MRCHGTWGIIHCRLIIIKSITSSISYNIYTSCRLSTLPSRSSIRGVVGCTRRQSFVLVLAQVGQPVRCVSSLRCLLSQYHFSWYILIKGSYRKNPTICLEDLESLLQLCGAHSPNIVWGKLRSWQFVCLPTLHLLSLDCLRRGFRRTPTNHTMRLTWTLLTMPPLNYTITGTLLLHSTIFRYRQVKYSCDTSSFTLSRGLVPPFWSLVLKLIAVTSAVYVLTLRFTIVP